MIYADNAATTRMSEAAIQAMVSVIRENYGNPSSLYSLGQRAKEILEEARKDIADTIGAKPQEILFTSGGSEADNQAILSAAAAGRQKGKMHILSTAFEHHAVLHTLEKLKTEGFEVTLLDVHGEGIVRPEELEAAIREDTCLVTVMYANNEIGTIQPIREIGAICRRHGVLFHTDAVQAVGHLPIHVGEDQVDLLSASAHKFHGPKGVGFLYARKGVRLTNLIEGGAQENGKRAGTENVPGIAAMAAALKESAAQMEQNAARMAENRDRLIRGLSKIPHSALNGDAKRRLPGNVNFCFEGIPAAAAGRQGNRSVLGQRVHFRVAGSEPCAAGDRKGARRGARIPPAQHRRGPAGGRRGLYHPLGGGGRRLPEKLFPDLAGPGEREKTASVIRSEARWHYTAKK